MVTDYNVNINQRWSIYGAAPTEVMIFAYRFLRYSVVSKLLYFDSEPHCRLMCGMTGPQLVAFFCRLRGPSRVPGLYKWVT